MLPDGIRLIPLCLDVRRGAIDEFKQAIAGYEAKVAELAGMGVDVINPSGAPPFMVLGYDNEQNLIRKWEKDYKTRVFTSGTSHIDALRALAPTPAGRQALDVLAADSVLAWPLLAPPDLPAERARELRSAFDAMMRDPELVAEASRQGLEVDPVSGAEMQQLVDRLYATPPEVVDLVRKINAAH